MKVNIILVKSDFIQFLLQCKSVVNNGLLTRFFITPYQKSKSSGTRQLCWRGCGSDVADHAHIFWSCPQVQPFWKDVKKLTSEILGLHMDFSFNTLFLGHVPQGISKNETYLLKIFMVASKKTITKCWHQKNTPTIAALVNIINSIRLMEKMTFTLRLQKEKGDAYWSKWDCYYQIDVE